MIIKNEDIWSLSLKEITKILFNKPVYIHLNDNSVQQGIIKAIKEATNPNHSTHEHLPIGFVINEEYVDISKIKFIETMNYVEEKE